MVPGPSRRFVGLLFPLALLLLLPLSAQAQDDHANGANGATVLASDGSSVAGRIAPAGDYDVFKFSATAGTDYVAETTVSGGMDTVLHLYDPRGQHMTSDDDGGQGYASRVAFRASESGVFFLLVLHYDRQSGTGDYRVGVARQGGAPPTPSAPPAPTPPPSSGTSTSGGGVALSSPVFDPKLAGAELEITSELPGSGSGATTVAVFQGATRVVTLASGTRQRGRAYVDTWDGQLSGRFVPPGLYTVRVTVGGVSRETALNVVRLGLRAVDFTDDGRVPLAYHRAGGRAGSIYPLDAAGAAWTLNLSAHSAGCLDTSSGAPLSNPAPWAGTESPPLTSSGSVRQRGRSLPVAYLAGWRPRVVLRVGESASDGGTETGCGYPISGKPIRVLATVAGQVTGTSGELRPGGQATLDLSALPGAVGRHALNVRFRFQIDDGGWRDVPGYQETQHSVYTVLGQPSASMLPGGLPWVAALDYAATWAQGARDAEGVMDACVQAINAGFGLRYDADTGAPAYTDGWDLQSPTLDLDAFLAGQSNGRVVNCLDCAALVTKFAAQTGVDANVVIMGWNFNLNWLRGIGWSGFTHSLFAGYHAFSYHAWGSRDGGRTVHDACLSVDDDARPWTAPHAEGLPLGMPYDHYRDQLSPDRPAVQDVGRATVQQ